MDRLASNCLLMLLSTSAATPLGGCCSGGSIAPGAAPGAAQPVLHAALHARALRAGLLELAHEPQDLQQLALVRREALRLEEGRGVGGGLLGAAALAALGGLAELAHAPGKLLLPRPGGLRELGVDIGQRGLRALGHPLDAPPPVLEAALGGAPEERELLQEAIHLGKDLLGSGRVPHPHFQVLHHLRAALVQLLLHGVDLRLQHPPLLLLCLAPRKLLAALLGGQLGIADRGHEHLYGRAVSVRVLCGRHHLLRIGLALPGHVDPLHDAVQSLGDAAPDLLVEALQRLLRGVVLALDLLHGLLERPPHPEDLVADALRRGHALRGGLQEPVELRRHARLRERRVLRPVEVPRGAAALQRRQVLQLERLQAAPGAQARPRAALPVRRLDDVRDGGALLLDRRHALQQPLDAVHGPGQAEAQELLRGGLARADALHDGLHGLHDAVEGPDLLRRQRGRDPADVAAVAPPRRVEQGDDRADPGLALAERPGHGGDPLDGPGLGVPGGRLELLPGLLDLPDALRAHVQPPPALDPLGQIAGPQRHHGPQEGGNVPLHEHLCVAEGILCMLLSFRSEDASQHLLTSAPHLSTSVAATLGNGWSIGERRIRRTEGGVFHPLGEPPVPHLKCGDNTPVHQLLKNQRPIHHPRHHLRVRLDTADKQRLAPLEHLRQLFELGAELLAERRLARLLLLPHELADAGPARGAQGTGQVRQQRVERLWHPGLDGVHHRPGVVADLEALAVVQRQPRAAAGPEPLRPGRALGVLRVADLVAGVPGEGAVQDLHQGGAVPARLHERALAQETDNARRARGRGEEPHALEVAHPGVEGGRDALPTVCLELSLEHDAVEEVLDALIGQVDEHLLKAIDKHVLETEYVKEPDGRETGRLSLDRCALTLLQRVANEAHNVVKQAGVDGLCHRVALSAGCLHADFCLDWRATGWPDEV
mmetsp:Transcript_16626/g.47387  ORF Transcript_16626/g.47387 Transcript_16626/m.47387 type:complete len:940 (+) Transcript_16626:109-2928(+)